MAFADLAANQMVSFTDASTGGFLLKAGQSHVTSNQLLSKSAATIKYNLSASPLSTYAENQLIPKSSFVANAVAWRGINPTCVSEPTTQLTEFDYLIIRYKWNLGAGYDLDTYTGYVNTGTDLDDKFMGFGLNNGSQIPTNAATAQDAYILWAGDNTSSSGVEAVLVNFTKFVTDNPTITTIPIRMAAAWYGTRSSGNIDIQVTTYLGGTMSKSGFNIINTGGTLVQDIVFSKNIPDPPHWSQNINNAVPVGYVTYYKTGKTAQIIITYA